MKKEIEQFDDAFHDGVFALLRDRNEPRMKVRAFEFRRLIIRIAEYD